MAPPCTPADTRTSAAQRRRSGKRDPSRGDPSLPDRRREQGKTRKAERSFGLLDRRSDRLRRGFRDLRLDARPSRAPQPLDPSLRNRFDPAGRPSRAPATAQCVSASPPVWTSSSRTSSKRRLLADRPEGRRTVFSGWPTLVTIPFAFPGTPSRRDLIERGGDVRSSMSLRAPP